MVTLIRISMPLFLFVVLNSVVFSGTLWAHCQIPCGIYDDEARFEQIAEDIKTVEKSMNQIRELSADPQANMNQAVRWVQNKEAHADKIMDTVSNYFLAQRVKLPAEGEEGSYDRQLELLHGMLVSAMKSKQTTDLKHVEELRRLNSEYGEFYRSLHAH